jgi:hypothetical protein
MHERLVDHLLGQLDAPARAALEAELRSLPGARQLVARFQNRLAPLIFDRDPEPPPPDLVTNTIAAVANHAIETGLYDSELDLIRLEHPRESAAAASTRTVTEAVAVPSEMAKRPTGDGPLFLSQSRANVIVLALMAFLVIGLAIPLVQKVRNRSQMLACQENLHQLHNSLTGYSETHLGQFPQVGTPAVPVASAFVEELQRSGQLPLECKPVCPVAVSETPSLARFAYSLGYRSPSGRLQGLTQRTPDPNQTPIAADVSSLSDSGTGRLAHSSGWNVLTISGSVRFTTTPILGSWNDHIFFNDFGQRAAGLHTADSCLGHGQNLP